MADRKIYFATDIHGSEVCLRKFLNAGKFYGCDTLIMGGDITGKMIVPIVDRGQGVYTATLYGRNLQVTGDGLAKLRKTIADAGYYAYETTPEEMERFRADPDAVTELFGKLMHETLGRWLELTEERLAGTGIRCFFAPGNDDPAFVDDILRTSAVAVNPEETMIDLDDGFTMISVGYSNKTPWDSPRELPEDELAAYRRAGGGDRQHRPGDLQLPRAAARHPDRPGGPAGRGVPPGDEGRHAGDLRGRLHRGAGRAGEVPADAEPARSHP